MVFRQLQLKHSDKYLDPIERFREQTDFTTIQPFHFTANVILRFGCNGGFSLHAANNKSLLAEEPCYVELRTLMPLPLVLHVCAV